MLRARHKISICPVGTVRISLEPVGFSPIKGHDGPLSTKTPKYKIYSRPDGPRSGFGALPRPTDFCRRGKKQVLQRAAAIELEYGRGACVFATVTLPGSTSESLEYTARYSGWIIRQLNQWLRDCCAVVRDYVYVWEHQKRGALHAHYLLVLSSVQERQWFAANWRRNWVRILNTLSDKVGVDMFARSGGGSHRNSPDVVQADVQSVTKSVARYLAKYLSKQPRALATRGALFPSRWWGSSKGAKQLQNSLSLAAASASKPLWDVAALHQKAVGLLSDAAGVVFQFADEWRPFRQVATANMSYAAAECCLKNLSELLCTDVPRSTARAPTVNGARFDVHAIAEMFGGMVIE